MGIVRRTAATWVASEAKPSRTQAESTTSGSPRRFAPPDDEFFRVTLAKARQILGLACRTGAAEDSVIQQ
jgi:hypothetical protein